MVSEATAMLTVATATALYKNLSVNGLELLASGVGSNCNANWATTTARKKAIIFKNGLLALFCKTYVLHL